MLKFDLSVEEANLILKALIKQPYELVSGLVTKIQNQAAEQLKVEEPKDASKGK